MRKVLIISSFKDQAYIELVKEKGYYKDVFIQTDDKDLEPDDMVVSLEKKYPINLCSTIKQAIEKLKLSWYVIQDNELENKTLSLVIS